MADAALAKKLLVKPGCRVLLLDAPAGYAARLEPDAETSGSATGRFDIVHLFARTQADVERRAAAAIKAATGARALWASYPKGGARVGTDLNRDRGWDALTSRGWVAVTQVAIDDEWSALRFRPEGDVGR